MCRAGLVLVAAMLAAPVWGESNERVGPRPAEITGSDVYVRSGPSANFYPVIKLNAGDRVSLVGENREWYEILPPEGTFSFISGDYVDTNDEKRGVVSGTDVRVRAGSALPEFAKNKYAVQTKLSRGAMVSILGRDPDGYLRITPPEGVTVWVHRDYVAMHAPVAPQNKTALVDPAAPEASGGATEVAPMTAPTSPATAAVDSPSEQESMADQWTFQGLTETPQRRELAEVDALVRAELAKPTVDRVFSTMRARYQVVKDQDTDEFASRYAGARMRQLDAMTSAVAALRSTQMRAEELESLRRGFVDERARIREQLPPIPTGLDAQGILRTSALYPVGSFPQRFRLSDATSTRDRTVAYVEVRANSGLDIAPFLNRYVGIRAAGKQLQTGGIQPVPIFVVQEMVLLDQQPTDDASTERG